jgi:hypothetical protein
MLYTVRHRLNSATDLLIAYIVLERRITNYGKNGNVVIVGSLTTKLICCFFGFLCQNCSLCRERQNELKYTLKTYIGNEIWTM